MDAKELSPSTITCPKTVCRGDGFCDVYQQVYAESDDEDCDENGFKGYARYKDTEWCSCTLETCLGSCPNSFLCGRKQILKWYLGCHDMRCSGCNMMIGRNLELVSEDSLPPDWECPVCMEQKKEACVFPDCPSKHTFCLGCMSNLLFGVEKYDEEGVGYWEGSTKKCPVCRHEFEPSDGWGKRS